MRISNIDFIQTYNNFGKRRRNAQNEPTTNKTPNNLSSKIIKRFHEEGEEITFSDKVIDYTLGPLLITVEKTLDVVGKNAEKALDNTAGKVIDKYREFRLKDRNNRTED